MEMEIKARRWLAVWFQCPECGAQSGNPMLTPTKKHRERVYECSSYTHRERRVPMQLVERRYYTTFAIETSISFTTIAGTLERIGPFRVCNIVYPDIRAFRKWVEKRRAELAEQSRQYMEHMRIQQEESEARRKREREEAVLLKEAEAVVYRRSHAVEMAAEQVARAARPKESRPEDSFVFPDNGWLDDLDDHPF